MNNVILMGRLTRDPEVKYTTGENAMAVARYTLAVDRRRGSKDQQGQADFISCVAFGKGGEFAEKYLHKGTKLLVRGHIQTGSYTKQDGTKVYTTDVVVDESEFAESRNANGSQPAAAPAQTGFAQQTYASPTPAPAPAAATVDPALDGFMNIPDGIDEELPFN